MINFFLGIFFWPILLLNPDIAMLRMEFKSAVDSEEQTIKTLKSIETVGTDKPLIYAYKGALTALLAKHAVSPLTKLQKVKEGCAILDASVIAEPSNIEIRYLRYSTEVNIPTFLPYRSHLSQDESRIVIALVQGNSGLTPDMQKEVTRFMLKYASLSEQNRNALQKLIS